MDTGRNTKQKQLILETLKKDKSHPTILELYEEIKEIDPSLGQATVYRNVNKLVEEGKVKKIITDSGCHFDCDCNFHYHLACNKCGRILDIIDDKYMNMIRRIEKEYSVKIEDSNVLFRGICDKCCDDYGKKDAD